MEGKYFTLWRNRVCSADCSSTNVSPQDFLQGHEMSHRRVTGADAAVPPRSWAARLLCYAVQVWDGDLSHFSAVVKALVYKRGVNERNSCGHEQAASVVTAREAWKVLKEPLRWYSNKLIPSFICNPTSNSWRCTCSLDKQTHKHVIICHLLAPNQQPAPSDSRPGRTWHRRKGGWGEPQLVMSQWVFCLW